jgi:hypothetical protein
MKHYRDTFYDGRCRTESLLRLMPDLFSERSVLYIGARSDRMDYGEEFKKAKATIDVLEIYKPNVDYLKKINWINEVFLGDVRTFNIEKKYDVIFWWHGPEHILESELKSTLDRLEKKAETAVILGCPWGEFHQGPDYGNENEIHESHYDYTIFEDLGYTVECLGNKNTHGSNITSIKFLK